MAEADEGNVLDVRWVLSEETGQLMYEGYERVRSKPRQRITIANCKATVSQEMLERYERIADDRKARGIRE